MRGLSIRNWLISVRLLLFLRPFYDLQSRTKNTFYGEICPCFFVVCRIISLPALRVFFLYSHSISGVNPCAVNNGGCKHLCLLSAVKREGYSCACQTDINLYPDEKQCDMGELFHVIHISYSDLLYRFTPYQKPWFSYKSTI